MAAIDFDTLFTRLGAIGHEAYLIDGYQTVVNTAISTLIAEYVGTADEDLIGSTVTAQHVISSSMSALMGNFTTLAAATVLQMVQASEPSVPGTPAALQELVRQMIVGSQSVKASAVAASSAALSSNVGSGIAVLSTKRGDGLVQENAVAEVLRLGCIADSYTGSATAGQEQFAVLGVQQTAGLWDWNYPTGSNGSASANAVSADDEADLAGNLLVNGNAETWSGSPLSLDDWTLGTGTWGTDITRSGTAYRGSYAIDFIAGTGVNTALYQEFDNTAAGTSADPSPVTSYAVNFFIERAGVVSGGVLTVELVDGTGTVINDQQGVANSTTITLSGLTTSYVAHNVVFRIPYVKPAVIRLRFRMSTALAGADVRIDDICFAPLTAIYPGSPGFVVFAGATPFQVEDGFDLTVTNDRGGASYLATFQALFNRFFNMAAQGLLLPSSGSPTQADTKITV